MTDSNNNETPIKLNKLTLKVSPTSSSSLKQNTLGPKTNIVTVEVKKGLITKPSSFTSKLINSEAPQNQYDLEVNKRIGLLKKAAIDAKAKDEVEQKDISLKTLSQIVANAEIKDQFAKEALAEEKLNESNKIISKENIEIVKDDENAEINKSKVEAPAKFIDEEDEEKKRGLDAKVPVKAKWEEPKKLKKTEIIHMLGADEDGSPMRTRSLASIKRSREKEKRKYQTQFPQEKVYREVIFSESITVGELSNRMSERVTDVIKELMKLGLIASANQSIDSDTAELIITTMGHIPKKVQESDIENILQFHDDKEADLLPRPPVVTVMGHVDHGKTSLLDALKSTDIAGGEAGGITQHIGAYRVRLKSGQSITFIDTPGHEAFSEMRSRGAKITDIVVLVVAADDGIMTQTIEAINHAKAANVPIIVAVNKIDKADANVDRIKNELLSHDLVPEDFGGDIMVVPVSALKATNLDKLEEAILFAAELSNLKSNPNASASGVVIESKIDKGKGVMTTLLVQRGTLKVGDIIVAGESFGKVRRMSDDRGSNASEALPSDPIEILGLDNPPLAGETFSVVQTEKQARDIAEYRQRKSQEKRAVHLTSTATSLEELFKRASGDGSIKELPIILKGDVQGSIEAINGSLGKIFSEEVKIKIIHSGVGAITESDVALASATGAIIMGFNVRISSNARNIKEQGEVDIRYYSIIYNLVDDVKAIMSGMLSPIIREVYIGSAEIRQVFNITKVGKVSGCYVTKGVIKRGAGVRLLRDDVVVHEGKLKTLKRFKDEVKEVRNNFECGMAFEHYDDMRVGDTIEAFEIVEEKQVMQ